MIRDAIQTMLDAHDDGWSVTQFVIVMGLERVSDGRIETIECPWPWAPAEQPAWITAALLEGALRHFDPDDDGD